MKALITFSVLLIFSVSLKAQVLPDSVFVDSVKVEAAIKEVKKAVTKSDTTGKFFKTMGKVFGVKPYTSLEKPRVAFIRSLFLPGWGQITNRDFWKVGLVYGAAGAGWYYGIRANNQQYQKYLGHYERATFVSRNLAFYDNVDLSIANSLPQSSLFFVSNDADNAILYVRDTDGKKYVLNKQSGDIEGVQTTYFVAEEVNVEDSEIIGSFNSQTFQSAKNQYRRWRDASYIGFAAGWLFFALEANVAAHLKTFDMSEDISFKIKPAGPQTFGMQASGISLAFEFK
ncbi:DUF5683 domain-containing protein [Jiulongibacter sediminis]|uniref:DUF5683 domain-containing protein n=1 Tax=Jiulongibacter sediminis TaxID=1605367 RepID=A0A0P7BY96_9BACT|nr:DUF5683 domain-containing protein [Jiulongibacter sediminis]KPM49809.1 hypothetical protein AFM12_04340 [Jiulongibacter sediminis]TBX26846.1 hypothetical protein TK44_04345 [Jiulongibacter sediminis]